MFTASHCARYSVRNISNLYGAAVVVENDVCRACCSRLLAHKGCRCRTITGCMGQVWGRLLQGRLCRKSYPISYVHNGSVQGRPNRSLVAAGAVGLVGVPIYCPQKFAPP